MQVWMTIEGTQRIDDNSDTVELSTVGELTATDNGWCLTYNETQASGMPDVTTVLTVTDTRVTLTRSGRVQTQMILEQGCRHQCAYDTGYGILQLGFYTDTVQNRMTATGGEVYFSYTMDQNGNAISAHSVRVRVTKKG